MATPHFDARLFEFLVELRQNNNRDWFTVNKARFDNDVKAPLLRFISDLQAPMAAVAPEIVVDPRPVGGSMFRIYRDTRFGTDKTPYKTHAAAHFRHKASTDDVHGPGIYLHLEPGECLLGAGIWCPTPPSLKAIRDAVVADPQGWLAARGSLPLGGESLKRPPAGYDPAHPCIDDLKRKDFVTMAPLGDDVVFGPALLEAVIAQVRAWRPFQQYLTRAVGFAA